MKFRIVIMDYQRLNGLISLINNNKATQEQKQEYMLLLYQDGAITKEQYKDYISSESNSMGESLLKLGLTLGGIVILGYALSSLFKK